ncbi:hypothetical protein ACO3VM_03175 [Methanocaldococcus sp. 10A]
MQVKEVEIVPHDIYGQRFYVLHLFIKRKLIQKTEKRKSNGNRFRSEELSNYSDTRRKTTVNISMENFCCLN